MGPVYTLQALLNLEGGGGSIITKIRGTYFPVKYAYYHITFDYEKIKDQSCIRHFVIAFSF